MNERAKQSRSWGNKDEQGLVLVWKNIAYNKEEQGPIKQLRFLGTAFPEKFYNEEFSMWRGFIAPLTCEDHFVPQYIILPP